MDRGTPLTSPESWDEFRRAAPRLRVTRALHPLTRRRLRRFLREQIRPVTPGPTRVLELGCAPGAMLENLRAAVPELLLAGLDYAPASLEATRARLDREVELYLGDLFTADLPPIYDYVVSFGLIEHFEDPREVIACHARLCRPGRTVLASVPPGRPRQPRLGSPLLPPEPRCL